MKKKNAMENELEKLSEQWEDFIATELPILHWSFAPADIQLALAFVKVKEQLDEKNPELFIHLSSEFTNAKEFGALLAHEMNAAIENGIADAMMDEEPNTPGAMPFTWRKPDLGRSQSSYHALFQSCKIALDAFEDYVHNITLVVTPSAISDAAAYTAWWSSCCDIHATFKDWPKKLRLVFFDTDDQSELRKLAKKNPQHIHSAKAPVDLQQAMQDILKDANDGSPGAEFRQHSVDLQQAVGKQDRDAMERIAHAAIVIAERENWLDMWVVILLTRAMGYLNLQWFDQALVDYRTAQNIAAQGEERQVPGCNKLHLQAKISEGTCLLTAGRLDEAAQAYDQAAQMAEQQQDLLMSLEGWRMASFCMERNHDNQLAWEHGKKALVVGRAMDAQQRVHSTLPFLGQALLRISPSSHVKKQVKTTFAELLGESWLEDVEGMTKAC